MVRELIKDIASVKGLIPTWMNTDFAYDIETSGVRFIQDRVVGLALTFANGDSFYLCCEHTTPQTTKEKCTRVEQEVVGWEIIPPKTKRSKEKRIPIYEERTVEYEEDVTTYPTTNFIDRHELIQTIQPLFDQPSVLMVAHNAKFDREFLKRLGLTFNGKLIDTMLAAFHINENRSVGLKELAYLVGMELTEYQELEHYPTFHRDEYLGVPLNLASNYAMLDTEATLKLWTDLFQYELSKEEQEELFYDVSMPLSVVLQGMEEKGIALDIEYVKKVLAEYKDELAKIEAEIIAEGMTAITEFGMKGNDPDCLPNSCWRMATQTEIQRQKSDDSFTWTLLDDGAYESPLHYPTSRSKPRVLTFSPTSDDHIRFLLYDHYKLRVEEDLKLKSTKSGKPSVDVGTLTALKQSNPNAPPLLELLLKHSKKSKFISAFLERFVKDHDPTDNNCLRASFNQHIVKTGRLSCSNPNLMQIPSRKEEGEYARKMFIARPNMSLIVADLSMAELRMLAHFSQDETLMHAFTHNQDLHIVTAANQSNSTYDALFALYESGDKDAKMKRQIGKTSNFGLTYGMGARKYQALIYVELGIYIPLKQVQALINSYNETFYGAALYKEEVKKWAHRLGYVQTIGGSRRRLVNLTSSDRYLRSKAERDGVNMTIQGSVADVMKLSMIKMAPYLEKLGAYLLLQVHDELVVEAPTKQAEEARKIMEYFMSDYVNKKFKMRCPLVADAHIGPSWYEAKG